MKLLINLITIKFQQSNLNTITYNRYLTTIPKTYKVNPNLGAAKIIDKNKILIKIGGNPDNLPINPQTPNNTFFFNIKTFYTFQSILHEKLYQKR